MKNFVGISAAVLALAWGGGCSFHGEAHAGEGDATEHAHHTSGGEAPSKGSVSTHHVDPKEVHTIPTKDHDSGGSTHADSGTGTGSTGTGSGKADEDEDDTNEPPVTEVDDKPGKDEPKNPPNIDKDKATGQPSNYAPRAATAFWVWFDEASGYWKVRTTSKEGNKIFRGRVGVSGPKAKIADVRSVKKESDDQILTKQKATHFAFKTGSGSDGIDVMAEGQCTYFRFVVEETPTFDVFLGKDNVPVGSARFRVCDAKKKKTEEVKGGGQGI